MTPLRYDSIDAINRELMSLERRARGETMKLREYKEIKMKDPEFARAYEEIKPEMSVIRAMIEARLSQNLTQKELAERTGISQTEISKLENGTRNPSIKLLQRLADGMGMVLNVTFTPKDAAIGTRRV